jgi:hypothetical protein
MMAVRRILAARSQVRQLSIQVQQLEYSEHGEPEKVLL